MEEKQKAEGVNDLSTMTNNLDETMVKQPLVPSTTDSLENPKADKNSKALINRFGMLENSKPQKKFL